MRRTALVLLAMWFLVLPGSAAAQSDTATVTLVHGFRGLLADVYLDGDLILEGFRPARSTDPTQLPAGEHTVEVREADAAPDSTPVVEGTLQLPSDANLSAVVHPAADGEPTISVFDNAFNAPGADTARVVVRHTAMAPAIDVTFGTTSVVTGLKPGQEGDGTVQPGADDIATVEASSSAPLLPPARINADPESVIAVYLIGSADNDSLGWLSQRLDTGEATMPVGVPTGDSGLVATAFMPWWAWAAAALALLTAAVTARAALATARAGD